MYCCVIAVGGILPGHLPPAVGTLEHLLGTSALTFALVSGGGAVRL